MLKDQKHDYERGSDRPHPMHTDTPCRICGKPKADSIHDPEEET